MTQQDTPESNPAPDHSGGTPEFVAPLAFESPLNSSSPKARGSRRTRVGTRVAIAALGVGALGFVGTAFAASATTSAPDPSATSAAEPAPNDPDAPGNGPGRMGARANGPMGAPGQGPRHAGGDGAGTRAGGLGIGRGGAIHGSAVVPKAGGGYQTVDGQRGTVTAVSADSITVHSEDGFDKTYVVNADTVVNGQAGGITTVKVDDKVAIMGIEAGDTTTAVHIRDRTQGGKGAKPLAPPNPAPTASTT
ncbi:unannotated protein [freshwater metagenome]|uniref:Unannotated protein n=1 Tax=freshwater metagenome TaxID=449393 RepID=A0A6J7QT10_9ZZZZ|nr:hypothetical protein [Actinomycetota bacterium]MSW37391.1 hypothetical protein [Actinomycetota bacterium]MSX38408.1 hypothetical protein [Actinomycetota bacterium]